MAMENKLLNLLRMGIKAETRAAALYALGTMIMSDGACYELQIPIFDQLVGWVLDALYMVMFAITISQYWIMAGVYIQGDLTHLSCSNSGN